MLLRTYYEIPDELSTWPSSYRDDCGRRKRFRDWRERRRESFGTGEKSLSSRQIA